jgi:alpha-galactosidase/6-phospho-beta-glucosidase family protein
MTKIVIIGAGSSSFGPGTLATLVRSQILRGCHIALVDLNGEALEHMRQAAERMNHAWDANMTITASANRKDVLQEANFVIVSIEVPPREVLWRMDWEIPLKHGLRQPYGENGGPGGLMHACRQIPPFIEIVRDMEQLCPDAWLINFSNPLPRITRAIYKYSRLGIQGSNLPPLPASIAELCRREAALVEMVVDAAVSGDRQTALQALLLDPMINDIKRAQAILDDYLTAFADYLPQFS